WHYHVCEGQFVYMLRGWVDLEFEDGQKLRIQAGESLYIPGGLRHNETGASRDLELLEISVPADMGTVPCDPPEGWSARAGPGADADPARARTAGGPAPAVSGKRIPHVEAGKASEVPVRRPELTHSVQEAQGRHAGIMDARADHTATI